MNVLCSFLTIYALLCSNVVVHLSDHNPHKRAVRERQNLNPRPSCKLASQSSNRRLPYQKKSSTPILAIVSLCQVSLKFIFITVLFNYYSHTFLCMLACKSFFFSGSIRVHQWHSILPQATPGPLFEPRSARHHC